MTSCGRRGQTILPSFPKRRTGEAVAASELVRTGQIEPAQIAFRHLNEDLETIETASLGLEGQGMLGDVVFSWGCCPNFMNDELIYGFLT